MPKARRRSAHSTSRFEDMALSEELLAILAEQGLTRAFEIQEAILPDALAGRDVMARAETGSGKTLAFALSMCARFRGRKVHRRRPLGLVLVPTRELAVQVVDTFHPFARAVGIRAQLVAGGMNIEKQAEALRRGAEIVVATPGRLIDLAARDALFLDRIETTVVDEADHMADLGFLDQVGEILAATPMGTQKMLFSATLDGQVETLVDSFLVDPVEHETTPVAAAVKTMTHHVLAISPKAKREVIAQLAARRGRTLVFTRTQLGAERVAAELVEVGVQAAALHGNKQQGLRTNVLAGFREGDFPVLVATDVAARGLHIDDVSMVVHADPATDAKEYVHRSGRTARAGAAGSVVTLALPHQTRGTRAVLEAAEVEPAWEEARSADAQALIDLGGRTPSGEPAPDPAKIKHKGAPRKLRLSGGVANGEGANAARAEERRTNEELRAAWDEEAAAEGGPSAGRGGRRGAAGSGGRGPGGRGSGGRSGAGRSTGQRSGGRTSGRTGQDRTGGARSGGARSGGAQGGSRSGGDPASGRSGRGSQGGRGGAQGRGGSQGGRGGRRGGGGAGPRRGGR
ncbi:DEAD/DEAH box helicase [Brachybacterium halotolerans subsp. kimchii]|uniref:DEAD/DEAH box helicase n=1 Tax=Brachybacterium halotolerans TaxID=2795215 RepID=UPI001E41651E|nr:DEAD/DEAH box helicase [Brachybacterium halotolerans]UEJ83508.1 DEAD/DEAH box helicase [Brachybacterium halotolerans subsp. kimchii]